MSQQNPTFAEHDQFDLKPFATKLERFLTVEHDFVDGSLVISLEAPFGAGKSTFLSMWKSDLEERRKTDPNLPLTVTINAWESDYCGDPLLSVTSALIQVASSHKEKKDGLGEKLKEAVKDVGWFAVGLGNAVASHWSGLNFRDIGKLADEKKSGRQINPPDFVSMYEHRTQALAGMKTILKEGFGGELPKAFIFIDELDRCRPDYAVSYLETIKHVFDVHGLVFILAVDREQLESSVATMFGPKLRFADYFRKFAHRSIGLPKPDQAALDRLSNAYVTSYVQREGKRSSMIALGYRLKNIVELVHAAKMPPRQIQEAFRIIGHAASSENPNLKGQMYWCLATGIILMSILKVAEPEKYRLIGTRQMQAEDFGRIMIAWLGAKAARWWFCIYITGCARKDDEKEIDVAELFKRKARL